MEEALASASPADVVAALGDEDAFDAPLRSRSNGTYSTGLAITSSVTCGRPDHTLPSVMSAWTLPTVTRLLVSRSFGSCSVTSFNATFSDGHTPILVAPAIVSLYPVSRSTRSW